MLGKPPRHSAMSSRVSSSTEIPSDPLTTAVTRYLDRLYLDRAHAYRRELRACRHRLSRRAVHQLRVAIRHLLAAFELLRTAREDLPAVTRPLRKQLRILGDLRNAQLQRALVERISETVPPPLRRYLLKRERRRQDTTAQIVVSRKVTHRLKHWRPKKAPPRPQTAQRLRRLLDTRLRRAFDPLVSFVPSVPIDPDRRHEVRGQLREFRYLVESLPSAWRRGRAMTQLLSHLRGYQQAAGQIHDAELLLRRLERLVADRRVQAVSIRPLRQRLLSDKNRRLASCPASEQRLFRDAILARRALLMNLP